MGKAPCRPAAVRRDRDNFVVPGRLKSSQRAPGGGCEWHAVGRIYVIPRLMLIKMGDVGREDTAEVADYTRVCKGANHLARHRRIIVVDPVGIALGPVAAAGSAIPAGADVRGSDLPEIRLFRAIGSRAVLTCDHHPVAVFR